MNSNIVKGVNGNGGTSQAKARWDDMYDRLQTYKAKKGDCLVPNRYEKDPQLGAWVSTQRRHHKLLEAGQVSPLSLERKNLLQSIGFKWAAKDPRHVQWEARFQALVAFKANYGHTQVPINWDEDIQLANWVSTQRQEYQNKLKNKTTRLDDTRIRRLTETGFTWQLQRGGRKRHLVQAATSNTLAPAKKQKSVGKVTPKAPALVAASTLIRSIAPPPVVLRAAAAVAQAPQMPAVVEDQHHKNNLMEQRYLQALSQMQSQNNSNNGTVVAPAPPVVPTGLDMLQQQQQLYGASSISQGSNSLGFQPTLQGWGVAGGNTAAPVADHAHGQSSAALLESLLAQRTGLPASVLAQLVVANATSSANESASMQTQAHAVLLRQQQQQQQALAPPVAHQQGSHHPMAALAASLLQQSRSAGQGDNSNDAPSLASLLQSMPGQASIDNAALASLLQTRPEQGVSNNNNINSALSSLLRAQLRPEQDSANTNCSNNNSALASLLQSRTGQVSTADTGIPSRFAARDAFSQLMFQRSTSTAAAVSSASVQSTTASTSATPTRWAPMWQDGSDLTANLMQAPPVATGFGQVDPNKRARPMTDGSTAGPISNANNNATLDSLIRTSTNNANSNSARMEAAALELSRFSRQMRPY